MADEHTKSAAATVAFAQYSLTDTLREQFPFMRTSLLDEAVEATLTTLRRKIEEAKPQMTASKARSNFFSLPAELRNHIYDLAFMPNEQGHFRANFDESAYPIERKGCYRDTDPTSFGFFEGDTVPRYPSLLLVSRQVRAEAMPIYLSHLTVIITSEHLKPGQDGAVLKAKKWLTSLGPKHAKLIKRAVLKPCFLTFPTSNADILEGVGLGGLGVRVQVVEIDARGSSTYGCFW